jgi:hypothetical protein
LFLISPEPTSDLQLSAIQLPSGLPGYSPVWRTGGTNNRNFGAIGDEDLGHASADPASPASYHRNFTPSGDMVLDFSC